MSTERRSWAEDAAMSPVVRRLLDAEVHDIAGRYADAAAALDTAIAEARSSSGPPTVVVVALTRRAALLRYDGRSEAAGTLLGDAVAIAEASESIAPDVRIELDIERGLLALDLADPIAAEALLEHAVGLAGSLDAGNGRDAILATSLTALGSARRVRGAFDEADQLLRDAIGHADAAVRSDPTDARAAMALAHALDELGVLCKFSGRYEAGEEAYRRARELVVRVGGPDHPDLASIDHNLGGLAHARGDRAAAEAHARRAVDHHERTLGADHLATILDRSALAAILQTGETSAEAEALLRDCAERLERRLGGAHRELAVVLDTLAGITQRRGRLEEAAALYERARDIKQRALGPGSPSLAITLNNLATVQRRLGRFDAARSNYDEALDIIERAAGSQHPHLAIVRRNLDRLAAARAGAKSDGRQPDRQDDA